MSRSVDAAGRSDGPGTQSAGHQWAKWKATLGIIWEGRKMIYVRMGSDGVASGLDLVTADCQCETASGAKVSCKHVRCGDVSGSGRFWRGKVHERPGEKWLQARASEEQ